MIFPPKKAASDPTTKSAVMRLIEANENEALQSGDISTEEAEAELDKLFKELDTEVAAGRIKL
jgi:hypothetical protein